MNQHIDVPCIFPRDKKTVFEIFARYDFRDSNGHPLTHCAEFIDLVNAFCSEVQIEERERDKEKSMSKNIENPNHG